FDNGFYSHNLRKAIFVGDFIDRGSQIRETLQIVKSMVENGAAYAVMGNHEYNAICYHTKNEKTGNWLREHSKKNYKQHKKTLEAFKDNEIELENYLNWFKSLPLFIDFEKFKVVHACWDYKYIDFIRKNTENAKLNQDFLLESAQKNTETFEAVEIVLKGQEINLPSRHYLADKEGVKRNEIRVKWWIKPENLTYKEISIIQDESLPILFVDNNELSKISAYNKNDVPVFFGHYWMTGNPEIIQDNICCVDYSVAKHGKLVAYRYNNEEFLKNENFIF
ncbi:MAG: metallophosphoesterase, partial [Bacteroidales bacterium]|nr:metallophosphoesterase [Bacteroidales bacterium]